MAARIYVMSICKPLHAHSQFTPTLHQPMQKLPHCSSPYPRTKRPGWQQPTQCLISWSSMETSHNKSACECQFPRTVAWKANLETWDMQPSSQESLPNEGRGLPVSFLRTSWTRKQQNWQSQWQINLPLGRGRHSKTWYIVLCFLSSS